MESIINTLKTILERSIQNNNVTYFEDKLDFVKKAYFEFNTYEEVYRGISRWQVMRIFTKEKSLINQELLGSEKYDAILELYYSAKESL